MSPNINIFCSRKLPDDLILKAKALSIYFDDHDLMEIQYKFSQNLFERLMDQKYPLIFTSKIAAGLFVETAKRMNRTVPDIYAIKGATSLLFEQNGFDIAGQAKNGADLALMILSKGVEKAVFLCGNIHRPELPDLLQSNGIELVKHVVYEKKPIGFKATIEYSAYLFFSPSQFDALQANNQLDPGTPVFCIGKTTASHLRSKGMREVMYPSESRIENVVELAIKFFKHEHHA